MCRPYQWQPTWVRRRSPVNACAISIVPRLGFTRGKCQCDESFLFDGVRLGGAGGGTGAGGALYREDRSLAGNAPQTRHYVGQRAHVGGLFLHPDDVARGRMPLEFTRQISLREGIQLLDKNDGGGLVLAFFPLDPEFVADLAGAQEHAAGVLGLLIGEHVEESWPRKFVELRSGVGVAQHALWREHDQRLAPLASCLTAQQMEIL